jgi:hypothetical protein
VIWPKSVCGRRGTLLPIAHTFTLRIVLWLRLALVVMSLVACKGRDTQTRQAVLSALGMVDATHEEPEWLFEVCDASVDSTCESGELDEQTRLLALYAFARPGSHFEIHLLAAHGAASPVLGRLEVPPRIDRSTRALQAEQTRFLAIVRTQVCGPALVALRGARPRRTPLAETLTRITLSPTGRLRRRVVVMSDLREYSDVLDAECRPRPTRAEWLAKLRRRRLLSPGSLAGAAVHFVRTTGGSVTGRDCAWDGSHDLALRDLWRAAVEAAGATEVTLFPPMSSTSRSTAPNSRPTPAPVRTTETPDEHQGHDRPLLHPASGSARRAARRGRWHPSADRDLRHGSQGGRSRHPRVPAGGPRRGPHPRGRSALGRASAVVPRVGALWSQCEPQVAEAGGTHGAEAFVGCDCHPVRDPLIVPDRGAPLVALSSRSGQWVAPGLHLFPGPQGCRRNATVQRGRR